MSDTTELLADLHRIGHQLGGSQLTWEARSATFNTFANTMRELGYAIQAAHQIDGEHLQAFVRHRRAYVGNRTLANQVNHLRGVLEHIGKQDLARNPAYSNRALGIEPCSRMAAKQPLSETAIDEFRKYTTQLGRPGLGSILQLQRALGLRETEAICGGRMHTLVRWQRETAATRMCADHRRCEGEPTTRGYTRRMSIARVQSYRTRSSTQGDGPAVSRAAS